MRSLLVPLLSSLLSSTSSRRAAVTCAFIARASRTPFRCAAVCRSRASLVSSLLCAGLSFLLTDATRRDGEGKARARRGTSSTSAQRSATQCNAMANGECDAQPQRAVRDAMQMQMQEEMQCATDLLACVSSRLFSARVLSSRLLSSPFASTNGEVFTKGEVKYIVQYSTMCLPALLLSSALLCCCCVRHAAQRVGRRAFAAFAIRRAKRGGRRASECCCS